MYGNGHIESGISKSFYRIGEVSRLTDTKPFVLRYWETEFPMLQPVKSPKGHRLYRREDVDTVLHIKRLLYDEGFTIAGARRHLREEAASALSAADGAEHGADEELPGGLVEGLAGGSAARAAESASARASALISARAAEQASSLAATSISRKVLLDLRDALRAFLTVLESE